MPDIIDHHIEQHMTAVSEMVNADTVSERVKLWLESGEGYPESFTAQETEAIYAYAKLGRWCWFKENSLTAQDGE